MRLGYALDVRGASFQLTQNKGKLETCPTNVEREPINTKDQFVGVILEMSATILPTVLGLKSLFFKA